MRVYYEFTRRVFRRNAVYKAEYFMGLLNAIIGLFIGVAIWSAAYGDSDVIGSITKEQMVTYAVIGMLIRTMMSMDEYLFDHKIRTGELAVDLLKPYKFMGYVLSVNIGNMLFNVWTKVAPVLVVSFAAFHLVLPEQGYMIVLFLISLLLGYFVLFGFNLIVWLSAFWFHQTWSFMTIKNAVILLVSGATIPLWFMPAPLEKAFSYLPFKDIYFTPLSIFLGQVPAEDIALTYLTQIGWIAALHMIAWIMWRKAQSRLVIQGG